MRITLNNLNSSFEKIGEASSWNSESREELKMHKIHVYPAKFPSFLISKSLQYANRKGIEVNSIGDIFCGCGTTALEAKKNNKEFWGCDINPVATLIAKVKREKYTQKTLDNYYASVIEAYQNEVEVPKSFVENERLVYWFEIGQIRNLYKLLNAIKSNIPTGKYQDFFLVAFSNILKKASRWLTKSIKPTIDPKKPIRDVQKAFREQFKMMSKAVEEANMDIIENPKAKIVNKNFLNLNIDRPLIDMLITSPPYVTSYEYADLHQLSTLWLGYAKDFRELRNGTIGSVFNKHLSNEDVEASDPLVKDIYEKLVKAKAPKPKSVVKYFIDIKNTVNKSYDLINDNGLALFVIGNTTHKKVYINNAKYLAKCMLERGFKDVEVLKRKISSKILTPYRDKNGKFSDNKKHKKIYSYEYVVIGMKS